MWTFGRKFETIIQSLLNMYVELGRQIKNECRTVFLESIREGPSLSGWLTLPRIPGTLIIDDELTKSMTHRKLLLLHGPAGVWGGSPFVSGASGRGLRRCLEE